MGCPVSASTGIILTAGVITIGNDFAQGVAPAKVIRPAVAFLGTALIFSGLEKLDQEAAVGLAVIVMITVLIGGVGAAPKSPFQEVITLTGAK
jgi:hypothetical protein